MEIGLSNSKVFSSPKTNFNLLSILFWHRKKKSRGAALNYMMTLHHWLHALVLNRCSFRYVVCKRSFVKVSKHAMVHSHRQTWAILDFGALLGQAIARRRFPKKNQEQCTHVPGSAPINSKLVDRFSPFHLQTSGYYEKLPKPSPVSSSFISSCVVVSTTLEFSQLLSESPTGSASLASQTRVSLGRWIKFLRWFVYIPKQLSLSLSDFTNAGVK